MASRYASFDSRSSSNTTTSSPSSSSSDLKRTAGKSNLSTIKHLVANSSGLRKPSDPAVSPASGGNSSRALAKKRTEDLAVKNGQNFGSMVRKLIDKKPKPKAGSGLAVPSDPIKEDARKLASNKGSNFSALHRKLFQKGGSADRAAPKALMEVKSNTRTLAMVLRSERELLSQNKEYETEVLELRMSLEEKKREVEKLKDLCLKQREEIKALKDAILFPDVMNAQLQVLLEKQGSELKQAKQVIPTLQKQVTSLTGQLQCLAEDLAEVKADKYAGKSCLDGPLCSPRTPIFDKEAVNSLDFSSSDFITSGSPEDLFLKDLNPCLTPCFSKTKSKEFNEILSYDSP